MRHLANRLSHRALGLFGVIVFALAGAAAAYAVPLARPATDAWFAAQDGSATSGLLLGLLLSLTGVTVVRAFSTPKDRSTQ